MGQQAVCEDPSPRDLPADSRAADRNWENADWRGNNPPSRRNCVKWRISPALFIAHREELLHQAQRTSESSPGPKGQSSLRSICPRSEGDNSFTVVFYGLTIFACKTAQFCVALRESEMAETPSVSNAAQAGENTRKNSFLNYKSAALPTELCRRCLCGSRF